MRGPSKWLMQGKDCGLGEWPRVDFQMHTTWTDGRSTTAQMIAAAKDKRLAAIAVTEHINLTSTYYPDFVAELCELRARETGLEIYYGVEISIADYRGALRTAMDVQRQAEWAIGVVHSYPKEAGGYYAFADLAASEALTLELRGLAGLAENDAIDVLGHPGATYYKRFGAFPVEKMAPAFRRARDNGIAVEVNTRYCWDLRGLLELLRDIDPRVAFSSDAHHASEVGSNCAFVEARTHP